MAKNGEAREQRTRDYAATVVESSKELSPKERVMMKDTTGCVSLNAEVEGGRSIDIDVDYWVHLAIHNENAKDGKDYDNYIVVDKNGTRYSTGSPSFWTSFQDIMDDMEDVQEAWKLHVQAFPSKTREGKEYLKASVI